MSHKKWMALTERQTQTHLASDQQTPWKFLPLSKQILDAEFKQHGYRVPTITSPDIGVKFLGLFDKTVKMITPMLSRVSCSLDTRQWCHARAFPWRHSVRGTIELTMDCSSQKGLHRGVARGSFYWELWCIVNSLINSSIKKSKKEPSVQTIET